MHGCTRVLVLCAVGPQGERRLPQCCSFGCGEYSQALHSLVYAAASQRVYCKVAGPGQHAQQQHRALSQVPRAVHARTCVVC